MAGSRNVFSYSDIGGMKRSWGRRCLVDNFTAFFQEKDEKMSEIRGAIKSHIKICVQVFLHTHGKKQTKMNSSNPASKPDGRKSQHKRFLFWRWITGDGKDASLSRRIFAKKHENKWNKMRWRRKHIKRKNALDSNIVQKFWPAPFPNAEESSNRIHGMALLLQLRAHLTWAMR